MRLGRDVRKALKQRIEMLETERAKAVLKYDIQIGALRDMLLEPGNHNALGRAEMESHQLKRTAGTRGGLRATLTQIIESFPGVNREEAIRKVSEMGFTPSGKTSVRILVTSELHRLTHKGVFVRSDSGKYSLAALEAAL